MAEKSPILFLTYNRPDETRAVFEKIREWQPKKLYIASDGAKTEVEGDRENVRMVREYVTNSVDWDCRVETLFRDKSFGCKRAVTEAIDWFFGFEEEGMILEDDCIPHLDFFRFCEEMLARYREQPNVMMISGHNKEGEWNVYGSDYFFSNLGGIWGWASWRDAWALNDPEMKRLDAALESGYLRSLLGEKTGRIREEQFNRVRNNKIDTWDYQWGFSRHLYGGLSVVPSVNLVRNIGFGMTATHTRKTIKNSVKVYPLNFPLKENNFIFADRLYDDRFFKKKLNIGRILKMIGSRIKG